MEKENVLDLGSVTGLLNPVLPKAHKLWVNAMEPIISNGWIRLTGIDGASYRALADDKARKKARVTSVNVMKARVKETIQMRHDWIHNCGRPKSAVMRLTVNQAVARVREVRSVVEAVDDHLMLHRVVD